MNEPKTSNILTNATKKLTKLGPAFVFGAAGLLAVGLGIELDHSIIDFISSDTLADLITSVTSLNIDSDTIVNSGLIAASALSIFAGSRLLGIYPAAVLKAALLSLNIDLSPANIKTTYNYISANSDIQAVCQSPVIAQSQPFWEKYKKTNMLREKYSELGIIA